MAEIKRPMSVVRLVRMETEIGPQYFVYVKGPGASKEEEYSYRKFIGTPSNTEEGRLIKQEVQRQHRALEKQAKEAPMPAPIFEIDRIVADRSPCDKGYDMTKHLTIYYRQDGRERRDTPASLNHAIKEHPDRFPPGTQALIGRAVNEKVTDLENDCRPLEAAASMPEVEDISAADLKLADLPTAAPEASIPVLRRGEATSPLQMEAPTADPKEEAPHQKPWMEIMEGERAEVDQQACKVRSFRLLDVSKDEAGNLMIEAIINGELKEWSIKGLEEEICYHSAQYPKLALDTLRDKVASWKAQNEAKSKGRDPVDLLLDLARQDGQAEFFHDAARVPFVRVESGDHHEVKAVKEDFTDWLRYRAVKATGKAPKREPLIQAIDTLAVLAQFEGDEREVYIRKGEHEGAFYYDLCNESWQAIMITAQEWRLVDDPPAMFRRFDHMRPQVVPVTGRPEALDELVSLVNTSEEMRRLLKYHLVASQVPRINHYNAFFLGPQGSTKSTGNDIFKALDDPGTDNRDALPTKEDDLDLHLSKRCTAAYDNISRITLEVSDMLTRANSMSRSSRRALYTNNEENSRRYKTKIVLNAIGLESGVRPDLLDRTIIYNCEVVTEAQRMGQDEVNARIEELRPQALGACLDILVKAMPVYQDLKGRKGWSPRLKDAYLWMMAIAKVDEMAEGDFEVLFKKVIERRDSDAMEGDPLAVALEFIAARDGFAGTAGQLHEWLNDPGLNIPEACHIDAKDRNWPKSGIALGIRLPRIIAPLRSRGVYVYQCYHFEMAKNFTDKVKDLAWAKRGSGAYRDQDKMILIAKADLKRTEARPEA